MTSQVSHVSKDSTHSNAYKFTNTIGQPSFISSATLMACPPLKLKRSVLLVMYNWLNGFYYEINGKALLCSSLVVTNNALHY